MIKHFNIRVHGKVQRVFYRANAAEMANTLNIKGFARNEADGSVYIEAEGEEDNLKKFINACHVGSPGAIVERVVTEEGEMRNYLNFLIAR